MTEVLTIARNMIESPDNWPPMRVKQVAEALISTADAAAPWKLTIWLICQGGRPFDYRFGRSAAFLRMKELRGGTPSGDWSVEEREAILSILPPKG